jgi:hypothetical protein
MFWLCSDHPQVIFNGKLAQLVEHLTDCTGVLGSKPSTISCIFSIPVTVTFSHYTVVFFFVFVFYIFFFFTKMLNIFKYNQKRRFYNLQFNVTIYKYKIRHKNMMLVSTIFQKLENISFYYIMYTIRT